MPDSAHLNPAAALIHFLLPHLQVILGKSRALGKHVSEHNRRTAGKFEIGGEDPVS
jgi:hypothetical protein